MILQHIIYRLQTKNQKNTLPKNATQLSQHNKYGVDHILAM